MLCIAFVNGIVFLISHSASSLLDIEMQPIFEIDLVPSTLLYLFISSNIFLVKTLGFSIYNMSSANKDNLTSSFAIWSLFISFSCLISLARIFSTMLKEYYKSGKSGHPCLVPNLRGEAFTVE